MRIFLLLLTFIFLSITNVVVIARPVTLRPGTKEIVNFAEARETNTKAKKEYYPQATAELTIALDSTGSILTSTIKNTSTLQSGVTLYAFDLGIKEQLLNNYEFETAMIDFPAGVNWVGPTDSPGLSNTLGTFLLMAVEAMPLYGKELLNARTTLPTSFLKGGQSGTIQVTFKSQDDKDNLSKRTLTISPTAHFVIANPTNLSAERIRLISDSTSPVKSSNALGLLVITPLLFGAFWGLNKLTKVKTS